MLATMKHQFTELLSDIGFVQEGITSRELERRFRGTDGVLLATGQDANIHNENTKVLAAILVAALYPNVVQIRTPEAKFSQTSEGTIKLTSFFASNIFSQVRYPGYQSLRS
jgi:ATP-dependent RNA helicase DHX57